MQAKDPFFNTRNISAQTLSNSRCINSKDIDPFSNFRDSSISLEKDEKRPSHI
jgi:hypothetical protein